MTNQLQKILEVASAALLAEQAWRKADAVAQDLFAKGSYEWRRASRDASNAQDMMDGCMSRCKDLPRLIAEGLLD